VLILMAAAGCTRPVSLAGAYELVSFSTASTAWSHAGDHTLTARLLLEPDGTYFLESRDASGHRTEEHGSYRVRGSRLILTGFRAGSDRELDYTYGGGVLTLASRSEEAPGEPAPFRWTLKKR
jgi:hypothetical protein